MARKGAKQEGKKSGDDMKKKKGQSPVKGKRKKTRKGDFEDNDDPNLAKTAVSPTFRKRGAISQKRKTPKKSGNNGDEFDPNLAKTAVTPSPRKRAATVRKRKGSASARTVDVTVEATITKKKGKRKGKSLFQTATTEATCVSKFEDEGNSPKMATTPKSPKTPNTAATPTPSPKEYLLSESIEEATPKGAEAMWLKPGALSTTTAISISPTCGKRVVTEPVKIALTDFIVNTIKTGVAEFKKEFAELKEFKPDLPVTAFTANPERNRYRHVPCFDHTRAVLRLGVPPNPDYIHANWIKPPDSDTTFIATQGPLDNTMGDFWRLCYQEGVETVLMLCNFTELGKTKCAEYYPMEENSSEKYGIINVSNKRVVKESLFKTYTLELRVDAPPPANPLVASTPRKTLEVHLVHMLDWPDKGVPPSGVFVLRLLRRVKKGSKCIVHCSAGIGRTGTAIAINIALERLFKGIKVNLKELVKELRSVRALIIQTEAQYLFIHSTIFDYIRLKMRGVMDTEMRNFQREVLKEVAQ